MTEVHETDLPGVGTRFEFTTATGERVGVLVHRSGRREVLVYDTADPDRCRTVFTLSSDETLTFVEMLGASRVTAHLSAMQQKLEDLAIDWLDVAPGSSLAGRTLAESAIHTRTGVSVVAILRSGENVPAPGAGTAILAGDRIVAVGRPEGVEQLARELAGE